MAMDAGLRRDPLAGSLIVNSLIVFCRGVSQEMYSIV